MKALVIGSLLMMGAATASATTLDLTTAGAFGTINGAIFQQATIQSSGTGVIDSFLRVLSPGNTTTEQGYNTSVRPAPMDDLGGNFTRDLTISEVGTAAGYRVFLLDVNEPKDPNDPSASQISLDSLQIFLSATPLATAFQTLAGLQGALGSPIYNLDAAPAGDSNILLDAALSSGSGSSDMLAYIPDSLFTGTDQFVYLYSAFSQATGGFEEWATFVGAPAPVPEPGTMMLLGTGFLGLGIYFKRRRSA